MAGKEVVEKKEKLPNMLPQGNTGIVVQEKRTREEAVSEQMVSMIEKAGTIKLSKAQEKILYAPVKDEDVLIRPDGQLYLPWGWYQERLRKTFGFQWTLFPGGKVNKVDDLMIREWWLVIEGKPYGNCYGACEYKPNNPVMDYDDAVEGTRSNAIMRLCKHLGVATELWVPSWIKRWKDKYAIKYWDKKKGKYLWRKKEENEIIYPERDKPTVEDTEEAEFEEVKEEEPTPQKPTKITLSENQIKLIDKLKKSHIWSKKELIEIDKQVNKGINIIDGMEATIEKRKKIEKWINDEAGTKIELNGFLLGFLSSDTVDPDTVREVPEYIKKIMEKADEKTDINKELHTLLLKYKDYSKYMLRRKNNDPQ